MLQAPIGLTQFGGHVTFATSTVTVTSSKSKKFACYRTQTTPMDAEDNNSLLSVKSIKVGPDVINSKLLEALGDSAMLTVSRTSLSRSRSDTPTFAG